MFFAAKIMTLRAVSFLLLLLLALIPGSVVCTRCALKLTGNDVNGTISAASLSCTGGPNLAAAADPSLIARMHAVGVDWKAPTACNRSSFACLLSLCGGSDVTFEDAYIQGLYLSTGHVLCLAANSTVTIVNSQLVGNAAAMIHAQDASLTIINTTIKDNACTKPDQARTGVTVEGQTSRLHIEDSRFINNSHTLVEAPVMYIGGRTNATISNTNFSDNYAAYPLRGGGMLIDEDATGVSGHVEGLLRLLCAKLGRQAH